MAEAQLPREIRHLAKRAFYDLSIYQVYEIKRRDNTIYKLTIEDKTCRKKTIVENREMKVMYQLPKS